jgi:hypothetical protein
MFTAKLQEKQNAPTQKVKDIILALEIYQEWQRKQNKEIQKKYRAAKAAKQKGDPEVPEPTEARNPNMEIDISLTVLKSYLQLDKHSKEASEIIKRKVDEKIKNIDAVSLLERAFALN